MFWFFGCKACEILAPRSGIKLTPPALEGEVLTTGPPGKSHNPSLLSYQLVLLLHIQQQIARLYSILLGMLGGDE